MNYRYALGAFLVTMLGVTGVVGGDGLKSGPQIGDSIQMPFHPLNVTGEMAGEKHCLI